MEYNTFKEQVASFGVTLSEAQYELFEKYYEFLVQYNENVNLTAITQKDEVFEKHFLDSLTINKYYDLSQVDMLDIGAGAGFPTIPNAIVNPKANFTIVETLNKRCIFLEKLIELLEISNVTIVNERAEVFSKMGEKFDIISARAVARLNILLELTFRNAKLSTKFAFYKTQNIDEELQEARKAAKILGLKLEKVEKFEFNNNYRSFVQFSVTGEKIPEKYPRNFSQIKSKPLGKSK